MPSLQTARMVPFSIGIGDRIPKSQGGELGEGASSGGGLLLMASALQLMRAGSRTYFEDIAKFEYGHARNILQSCSDFVT
jgi:hypothetical protein